MTAVQVLDLLHAPTVWFLHLPQWQALLALGFVLTYLLGALGFVLARMGVKPLWSLLLIVPFANVIAIWILAYKKWPAQSSLYHERGRGPG